MIAAVILNYNSFNDCKECITDLKKQSLPITIIVVDNCSQEDDCNQLKTLCRQSECVFIEADANRGYNAGNNIGMRHAVELGCEYILISNPDMRYPDKEFVSKLIAKMQEDSDIVAIGGKILGLDGKPQSPMKRDGDWKESFGWLNGLLHPRRNKEERDYLDRPEESHYCSKLMGSCLAVKGSYVKSTDFFDEGVFLYCEEAILSRQIERDGKKMYYLKEAECIHAHKASEKGDPVKRFKSWKNSRNYFINKYSEDSWIGKIISKVSMSLYYTLILLAHRIHK